MRRVSLWFLMGIALLAFLGGLASGLALLISARSPLPQSEPLDVPEPTTAPVIQPQDPVDARQKSRGRRGLESAVAGAFDHQVPRLL